MSRKTLLWLIIPLIIIIQSCKQADTDQGDGMNDVKSQEPGTTSSVPVFGTLTGDTIHLSGKFVLFYAPDEKSFESQKLERDSMEYFLTMSRVLMDSLKSHPKIQTASTSAALFKIYTY